MSGTNENEQLATSSLWSHTYSYDKAGNRITEDGTIYTVNNLNEVTSSSDGTSFTYDSNGNRISKTKGADSWTYLYDDANRLDKVEKNGLTEGEYLYDGDGRRIQVTENSETTTYIYSGLNVLYEKNTVGTATYIYGPYGILAKRTTLDSESHTFYYHTDHLGSTRLVTDENRNIVTVAQYEPFGESTVTGSEPYLYTGKEKDSTGLSYYGARYYDSELGRFVTRDLLAGRRALPQSLNLYTYCLNNPVKFIDPAGLDIYCKGDGEDRVCLEVFENGWAFYDGKGNKLVGSNDKDPASQARAVYLMLLFTHPEIKGSPTQEGIPFAGGYIYTVTIEGKEIELWIRIREEFDSGGAEGHFASASNIFSLEIRPGEFRDATRLTVYQGAFQSIAALYHTIGHEGVHIYELATSNGTSEANAYWWNLIHATGPFPYPYDIGELINIYRFNKNFERKLDVPLGPAVPA